MITKNLIFNIIYNIKTLNRDSCALIYTNSESLERSPLAACWDTFLFFYLPNHTKGGQSGSSRKPLRRGYITPAIAGAGRRAGRCRKSASVRQLTLIKVPKLFPSILRLLRLIFPTSPHPHPIFKTVCCKPGDFEFKKKAACIISFNADNASQRYKIFSKRVIFQSR